jgi:hypothetical protein
MRLYPDVPARRTSAIARDAALVLAVVLFAWLGLRVHHAVDRLAVLGQGVENAGGAVQSGFGSAADAVGATPVVGGNLAGALRGAGKDSGGAVADAGRTGKEGVHRLARLLGWLTFLIPAALVLWRVLPTRIAEVRTLTAASRVLAHPDAPERRRVLAMRAAFALPYGVLLRHSRDPLGDLAAERYDGLVTAALEDAGLRPG